MALYNIEYIQRANKQKVTTEKHIYILHIEYCLLKDFVNMNVFRDRLKCSIDVEFLISSGKSFQSLGPAILNDLSAKVLFFVKGTWSRFLSADLVTFCDGFLVSIQERYDGAKSFRHLYTITSILKSALACTGRI